MKPKKVKGDLSPQKFFEESLEHHKKWMMMVRKPVIYCWIHLYKRERKRIDIIAVQETSQNRSPLDSCQVLIERFDPDYYLVMGEGWATIEDNVKGSHFNNKEEALEYLNSKYQYGDIKKLPRSKRFELLTAFGKTKDGKHSFQSALKIKRNDKGEVVGFDKEKFDQGTLHTDKLP
jgi:hypothetical protein